MQEQKIYGSRDGAVGHVVFNNPAKLNAVSLDMWDAFVGLLNDYEKDPAVRCVVVSGKDADDWYAALSSANGLTRFVKGDHRYQVTVRFQLPDEPLECPQPAT